MLERLSETDRNAGFGVFWSTDMVGGSTGSIGVGASADYWGWYGTFVLLAALFSISFSLVVVKRGFRLGY